MGRRSTSRERFWPGFGRPVLPLRNDSSHHEFLLRQVARAEGEPSQRAVLGQNPRNSRHKDIRVWSPSRTRRTGGETGEWSQLCRKEAGNMIIRSTKEGHSWLSSPPQPKGARLPTIRSTSSSSAAWHQRQRRSRYFMRCPQVLKSWHHLRIQIKPSTLRKQRLKNSDRRLNWSTRPMVWLALAENSTGNGRIVTAAGSRNQSGGRGCVASSFPLELNCLRLDERSPWARRPLPVDGCRPQGEPDSAVTAAVDGATGLMHIGPVYFVLPTVCSFRRWRGQPARRRRG